MEVSFFALKLCEKNSPVNVEFKIFVMAIRAENFLGPSRNGPPESHNKNRKPYVYQAVLFTQF